jgi:hypothetical protein
MTGHRGVFQYVFAMMVFLANHPFAESLLTEGLNSGLEIGNACRKLGRTHPNQVDTPIDVGYSIIERRLALPSLVMRIISVTKI